MSEVQVSAESADVTGGGDGVAAPGLYQPAPQVEAWRVTEASGADVAAWCGGTWYATAAYGPYLALATGEAVQLGDWVVRGPNGSFRTALDVDFSATYVPVESPPASG